LKQFAREWSSEVIKKLIKGEDERNKCYSIILDKLIEHVPKGKKVLVPGIPFILIKRMWPRKITVGDCKYWIYIPRK
jgi:hypothetical protein